MTSLQARRRRIAKPTLESLDDRIVPSAGGAGLRAQALEGRAIQNAEIRAARAEHRAELREARVQQLEARAQHRAQLQANRMQLRQAQFQHRAELRAARLHPGMVASTMTAPFTASTAPNTIAMTSATQAKSTLSVATATTVSANPAPTSFPNMVIGAPMPANPSDPTSTAPTASAITPTGSQNATSNAAVTGTPVDVSDVKNGPMAKAGQNLITVYTQYESAGAGTSFTLTGSLADKIRIQGDSVGVDVGTVPSKIASLSSTLTALGMQITATDPTTGMIEGFLPIAQLPTVSQNGDVVTLSPNYRPFMPPAGGGLVPR